MNILFYFTWQLRKPHFGIVVDQLEKEIQRGDNDIRFIYCSGELKPCYTNREGNSKVCTLCNYYMNKVIREYKHSVQFVPFSDLNKDIKDEYSSFNYHSIEDIKKIEYREINTGFAALSSYVSFTRNLDPSIDQDFRDYFDQLLLNQVKIINGIYDFIETFKPDKIILFNGRTANVRPVFEIGLKEKIDVFVLELIKSSDDVFYKQSFKNSLPHSISKRHSIIEKLWIENDQDEKKIEQGASFFKARRAGKLVRDRKIYVSEMKDGSLPKNWNPMLENIVIFNSSEDEFVAIGGEFEELKVFNTQEEGILWIVQNCAKQNRHFYLRIHPNLGNIEYGYHTRLKEIENTYDNVTVIPAKSDINSYDLMEKSDKVITFGSTMGIEATFWGKPSILLAASHYYYLDVAYKPTEKSEIMELLNRDLKVKSKEEACKYGYYLLNYRQYSEKCDYSPVQLTVFNKRMGLANRHLKTNNNLFISKTINKIVESYYHTLASFTTGEYNIPIKEENEA